MYHKPCNEIEALKKKKEKKKLVKCSLTIYEWKILTLWQQEIMNPIQGKWGNKRILLKSFNNSQPPCDTRAFTRVGPTEIKLICTFVTLNCYPPAHHPLEHLLHSSMPNCFSQIVGQIYHGILWQCSAQWSWERVVVTNNIRLFLKCQVGDTSYYKQQKSDS